MHIAERRRIHSRYAQPSRARRCIEAHPRALVPEGAAARAREPCHGSGAARAEIFLPFFSPPSEPRASVFTFGLAFVFARARAGGGCRMWRVYCPWGFLSPIDSIRGYCVASAAVYDSECRMEVYRGDCLGVGDPLRV